MQTFAENYIKVFGKNPTNVLEIGSKDGNDAHFLKTYFNISDDKVYIVEPNPIESKKIRLKYPNYKVYEFAISQSMGVSKFNAMRIDTSINNDIYIAQSSLLKRKEFRHDYEKEKLKEWENWINILTITGKMLLDIINDKEYDLVKIDVEGMTYPVIRSFGEDLKRLNYLHLEAEGIQLWENQVTYDKICDYMTEMGFKELYKKGDYKQFDTIWCNKQKNK